MRSKLLLLLRRASIMWKVYQSDAFSTSLANDLPNWMPFQLVLPVLLRIVISMDRAYVWDVW